MDWYSIKAALRRHWKWLAVSALVVASITLSCGQSVLSTSPVCISINMAIRGLLLPIATPEPVPMNNSKQDNIYRKTCLSGPRTCQNSFGLCADKIKTTKFATSTVANTANLAVPTITSVSLITRLMIFNSLRTTRDSTLTLARHWKNSGRTASRPWPNLTTIPRLILRKGYAININARERNTT